jgi:hypothetical protein
MVGRSVPPAVAADGAAADRVEDREDREDSEVERAHGPPVVLGRRQHAGLARVAPEAQHLLVVAPRLAVDGVRRRGRPGCWGHPKRRVHGLEPAVRRRLAAAGLHVRGRGTDSVNSRT